MTFKEFTVLMNVAHDPDAVMEQIRKLPVPETMCGKPVPADLNGISIGQLIELQECKPDNVMTKTAEILLGATERQVAYEQAEKVLAFNMHVSRELTKIAELFQSISIPMTDLQKKAGYDKLNFGPFAILDSFALRMGITDHEEVEKVPWVRIFKCMQMDAEREICRRRAEEIQLREMQRKK